MTGVLVDTSVWIEFFNGTSSQYANKLSELIESEVVVWTTPTILQEILQGFKSDNDFETARELLHAYPLIKADPVEAAIGSAMLYRTARKNGITIRRSNDCLIAWYAIKADLPIFHKDRDFDKLTMMCELEVIGL